MCLHRNNVVRAGLAIALMLSAGAARCAERPLTMRDIARMRYQRVPQEKIVDKATELGVSFEVTPAVQNQLQRLGFTAEHMGAIKDASESRDKGDKGKKGEKSVKGEEAEPAAPVVPGQGLRSTDAQRDRVLEQIKQINRASGADLHAAETRHTTLWAARDDLAVFLPSVKKLERFLETRCKEPIRSGLDKRSAHIVLVQRRYEYQRWIKGMFEIVGDPFKNVNAPGGTDDLKKALLKGVGYVTPNFSVLCLEDQPTDWVHRMLATDMGYMTFTQLAESQHNEPLATGFANGLETFLAGSPRVMLFGNSYGNIDRDLGNDPGAWLHLVQQRIAARKVSGVRELLGMDTTNMVLPHYAEAWTLAGLLAKQPARFADLVLALREEKDAVKEIERIYGWDEKKLADEWHKQVLATK